jgi:hypothetical protein
MPRPGLRDIDLGTPYLSPFQNYSFTAQGAVYAMETGIDGEGILLYTTSTNGHWMTIWLVAPRQPPSGGFFIFQG